MTCQVIHQCRQRSQLDLVETSVECQLVPQQTYQLRATPGHVHIQPEVSDPWGGGWIGREPRPISCPDHPSAPQTCTFVNDSSYNYFLPSFHLLLPADVSQVELRLRSYTTSLPLIGWLLGDTDVWCRLINLGGQCPPLFPSTQS